MADNKSNSFVRWQKVTLKQMGGVINLVLGLSADLLAFNSKLLIDKYFIKPYACLLNIIASVLIFIAIGCALWCSLNRLKDFRLTAQIARDRE
jgi:fumarate reductase subunit D